MRVDEPPVRDVEVRAWSGLEIRQEARGRPRLVGYAAVFNRRSVELPPGFVEVIRPGAFTRSLRETPDLRAFVEHDPSRIIGRVSAGTLTVAEDPTGLRVEITPIDTRDGEDVVRNVRAGNLDGMSFSFALYGPEGQAWDWAATPPVREVRAARVVEVSVVALPAYPDTSVAVRAFQGRAPRVAALQEYLTQKQASWRPKRPTPPHPDR